MMFPSNKIQGMFTAEVAEVFDYFEFDSENKVFQNCDKCSHLNFIKSSSYIRIDDMFALNKAQNIKFKFPDFARNYEIQQRNLIRNLVSDGNYASFTYVSPRAKTLLTTAGEILELYTYFEALKTGYFDDAACSYEFKRQQGNVKNEIDCILVKGLHTMIIECKSCKQINQDYYHKLNSIADQFGVNCKKVLTLLYCSDNGTDFYLQIQV